MMVVAMTTRPRRVRIVDVVVGFKIRQLSAHDKVSCDVSLRYGAELPPIGALNDG